MRLVQNPSIQHPVPMHGDFIFLGLDLTVEGFFEAFGLEGEGGGETETFLGLELGAAGAGVAVVVVIGSFFVGAVSGCACCGGRVGVGV